MSRNAKRFRQAEKPQRQQHQRRGYVETQDTESNVIEIEFRHPSNKPIEALTDTQASHIASLRSDTMVVAIGAAGVGKTYIAAAIAADLFKQKHFKYLILTRPNVEVGKSLGYLPGDMLEKYAPYLEPFQKALVERLGSNKYKCDLMKTILPKPLGFMRGDTFDDAIVLLDEAQNTTIQEMKMLLTRIGVNSKLFITGDIEQCDIHGPNGLSWLVKQLRTQQKPYDIIQYSDEDCVRSDFAADMVNMIRNEVKD